MRRWLGLWPENKKAFHANRVPVVSVSLASQNFTFKSTRHFIYSTITSEEDDLLYEALKTLGLEDQRKTWYYPNIFARILWLFTKKKDLAGGRHVKNLMAGSNFDSDAFYGNHLIRMFSACGSLVDANQIFRKISMPDTHSWAAIISAHTKHGRGEEAIMLYLELLMSNAKPNAYVYVAALNACASTRALEHGISIHKDLVEAGYESNVYVGNSLIDMYAKCGRLVEARHVFNSLAGKDVVSWNTMVAGYVQQGFDGQAFQLFETMSKEHLTLDSITFTNILKACANEKDIERGEAIHDQVVKSELSSNTLVGNALIDLYVKCGNLEKACRVFDSIQEKNIVSWSAIIAGYAQLGQGKLALELFNQMQETNLQPDNVVFASIIKACTQMGSIHKGKEIHVQIIRHGLEIDPLVGNTLVEMYARCRMLDAAQTLFNKLFWRKVTSWNAMIMGYAKQGLGYIALHLFATMQLEGLSPDAVTFMSMLKVCGVNKDLNGGKLIHEQLVEKGFEIDLSIGNSLISMYAKCGNLVEARSVFNKLHGRDSVTWTTMIAGYAQNGCGNEALNLFGEMQENGVNPKTLTFVSALNACGSIAALERGRSIHAEIIKSKLGSDPLVQCALVSMYIECRSFDEAYKFFDGLTERDVVTWRTVISGLAQQSLPSKALQYLKKMQQECIQPDTITFVRVLKACDSIAYMDEGLMVHSLIQKSGLEFDQCVGTALIGMYSKWGLLVEAYQVFDKILDKDIACWNVMISGYTLHGSVKKAFQLYGQMKKNGLKPNGVTFISILKALNSTGAIDQVKLLHEQIIKSGFEGEKLVINCLLDTYMKCGHVNEARQVFDSMPERDLVSWGAMISGYARHGLSKQAFELFNCMQVAGVKPDTFILASALKACGVVADIDQGKWFHAQAIENRVELDVFVGNALVDMYAKCGSLSEAFEIFNALPVRDVVSYNGMIGAYAQHGYGVQALHVFKAMQQEGFKPTDVTVSAVLTACSHARLVDEARFLIQDMFNDFGILPTAQHFTCIIDLLARAGKLYEAQDLIKEMQLQPDSVAWMSLLGACRIHGNVELGRRAFESILKLNPTNPAAYILMSDIYAKAGRWKEMEGIRKRLALSCSKKII